MTIPEFIARCDRFVEVGGVSRVWLSKRLFNDTFRLDHLASGQSDVGVKRLSKACEALAELECGRGGNGTDEPGSHDAPPVDEAGSIGGSSNGVSLEKSGAVQ